MAEDIAVIGIRFDGTDLERGKASLEAIAAAGPKVETSLKGVEATAVRTGKTIGNLGGNSKIADLGKDGAAAAAGMDKLGQASAKAGAAIGGNNAAIRGAATGYEAMKAAVDSFTAAEHRHMAKLAEEYKQLTLNRGEMERYRAAQAGMSAGAQDLFAAAGKRIEALKLEQQAMKDMAKSADQGAASMAGMVRVGVGAFLGGSVVQGALAASKAMFSASAEAERLRTMLNFSTGGKGAQEIEYLRGVTQRLGLEFASTGKAYGQFQAAAKGTALEGEKARAVFESVAKASAVMGLSASDASGVLLALQQMVSKGTVQAEELRGQLGERLPGALQIAAKAMGVTTAELGKMLEQGQVVADDFLPKFGKALEENIGGAAEKAAQRLDAAVNRFDSAWQRAKQNAGDSGVSEAFAKGLSGGAGSLDAISIAMEQARKQGAGFFGQLGAVSSAMYDLTTQSSRVMVNMYDNAEATKKAQEELARLQRIAATEGTSAWVLKEIGAVNRYIGTLQQAKRDRDALENGATSAAASPNMNAGVTASGQAREQYEARRIKQIAEAEAGLNDVRMRASGVNKSYLEDLKKWQAGLDAGSVSQKAYIEGVSALATATYKSSAAGKDAAASAKGSGAAASSAASAYASLISSINQKIEAERLELSGGDKLTASQRERIKLDADLAAGRVKLTAAQISSVRAGLDMLEVAEKQNSATREAMKVAMAAAAARSKEADSIKAWFDAQESAAAQALKSATDRITSLQGEEEAARLAAAMNISLASAIERTALARLREKQAGFRANSDGYNALQKEIEAREKILELVEQKGAREAQAASNQAMVQEWENTVKQYDDIFQKGFADLVNGGENAWKSFTKSLATTFKTTVADQIYKMFLRPFVVNVVGNLLGVSGAGGAMQAVTGGGGGGIMGMASNASSLNTLYGAGSQYLFGGAAGASTASLGYANTVGMFGGDSLGALISANGGWAGVGSGASAGVGAGTGAGAGASSGMAGMGAFAGYAAIVALVANAMGAFRSDKSVGGGLTGTLGKGDISGYELWREGGTLFDGPNFATKNPSELIARYESQLEALRGSGEGGTQPAFKLQAEITALQREYGAQIEATRKQSGALQLAYDGMRANVGNMADALGLGSAKVRDWTMAFGTDAVHPDLGGTAVIFDGLKDEEIAVKIQEALASANNTLAELVLGEWVTTTEEIRRTLESTAPIYGDMEIPGAWDEVTESVTRTTYVASQYARENEKAIDTLTRLAVSLGSVNQVFDALGVSAYEASLAGGDLASKLIDMLGGGEAFAAITGSYYENYYSEAERMGKATEALAAELAKAGVAMPTTKDAYRAIVTEALEAGEAGQALAAKLLGLSGAFAQVADYAEQAAEEMRRIKDAQRGQDIQLMELLGDASGALAARRADELAAMDPLLREMHGYLTTLGDLTGALSKGSAELDGLQKGLDGLAGTASKTVQQVLGDLMARLQATSSFRTGLAGTIEQSRLSGMQDPAKVAYLQAKEKGLWGALDGAKDPAAVAQELQKTILDRIGIEAALRGTVEQQTLDGLRAQLDVVQSMRDAVAGMQSAVDSLRLGAMSALNPYDQLQYAGGKFEEAYAKAQGGDMDAWKDVQSYGNSYVQLGRDNYASSVDSADIFFRVTEAMDQLIGLGMDADPQITALNQQIELLGAVDKSGQAQVWAAEQQVIQLTNLDNRMAQVQEKQQQAVEKQLALAQQQIDELKKNNELLQAQIEQQAAMAREQREQLNSQGKDIAALRDSARMTEAATA